VPKFVGANYCLSGYVEGTEVSNVKICNASASPSVNCGSEPFAVPTDIARGTICRSCGRQSSAYSYGLRSAAMTEHAQGRLLSVGEQILNFVHRVVR